MTRLSLALLLASLLAAGCGPAEVPRPTVIAHRAGASYWPENSRTALRGSIERGFPGVEFDLTLTKDLVPVVAHDPWLSETLCTTADGAALTGRVMIQDLTLAELQAGYRCGGVADPSSPGAVVVADTVMTFDDALDILEAAPGMLVHLDLKCEPGQTPPADAFAEQILGRWRAKGLPNPMYVDSGLPEVLAAFRARGPVTTTLSRPFFPAGESATARVLALELIQRLGVNDVIAEAKAAGADGLCMPYQIVDPHLADVAKRSGLKVQIFSPDTGSLLGHFCRWPVDVIISNAPGEAPCLR
jgi:glycerophosphoryl diester phosphodiesterase